MLRPRQPRLLLTTPSLKRPSSPEPGSRSPRREDTTAIHLQRHKITFSRLRHRMKCGIPFRVRPSHFRFLDEAPAHESAVPTRRVHSRAPWILLAISTVSVSLTLRPFP